MFASLPLLHTAQTATSSDVGLLACLLALGVGLTAGAAAGALSPGSLLWRPRARRRVAMFAVSALTFLAIAPAVVPYDHFWPGDVHDGDLAVHASHCHEAPASCADAPVTSGPGQLIDAAPLIVIPALLAILVIASTPVLVGVTRRPDLPPPLLSVAAYG